MAIIHKTPITMTMLGPTYFRCRGFLVWHGEDQDGKAAIEFDVRGATLQAAIANFPAAFQAAKTNAENDIRRHVLANQQAQATQFRTDLTAEGAEDAQEDRGGDRG